MTFALSDDEQNGVSIAVNTILKTAFNVGEDEDWSETASEWWNRTREEGKSAQELLADDPGAVVQMALAELPKGEERQVGIFVMPTEEGKPPRALFIIELFPGVEAPVGGVEFTDGAWRSPDGRELPDDLAQAITEHAENLGVEWDH